MNLFTNLPDNLTFLDAEPNGKWLERKKSTVRMKVSSAQK